MFKYWLIYNDISNKNIIKIICGSHISAHAFPTQMARTHFLLFWKMIFEMTWSRHLFLFYF